MTSYDDIDFSEITQAAFWAKVDRRSPDECWPYRGIINHKGYGRFQSQGTSTMAHRYALQCEVGDIGDLLACHRCDNPPCVNPAHLFAGTNTQNMTDANVKGRRLGPHIHSPTHCRKGHDMRVTGTLPNRKGVRCAQCRRDSSLLRLARLRVA